MSKPSFLKRKHRAVQAKLLRLARTIDRHAALIAVCLALGTLLLVSIGTWPHSGSLGFVERCIHVAYVSAQTLYLNMNAETGSNPAVNAGKFFAVAFVVFVSIQVIGRFVGDSWQRLMLMCMSRHHVVCGLGWIGWQLTRELLSKGHNVVVIEKDANNPRRNAAFQAGAIVVVRDVTEDDSLADARAHRAVAVYVTTGSDQVNLQALANVQQLGASGPDTCYLHITDNSFEQVLRGEMGAVLQSPQVKVFNVLDTTARQLILEHLIAIRPRKPHETALYLIIGFERMGQALAKQLAELAHFENSRRSRLLILCENASQAADQFLSRWPQFSPRRVFQRWCDVGFDAGLDNWSDDAGGAIRFACNAAFAPLPRHGAEQDFSQMVSRLIQEPGLRPAVIAALEHEQASYIVASTLEEKLTGFHRMSVPIFLWLPRHEPLVDLIRRRRSWGVFGQSERAASLESVASPLLERLAMAILAQYEGLDLEKDRNSVESRWHQLPELFRYSNQSAAFHALVKLAILGYRVCPAGAPSDIEVHSPSELELQVLAKTEHYRWVAERLMAGWRWGTERRDRPPERPQLCTWESLVTLACERLEFAQEPAKDFQQVIAVREELHRSGYLLTALSDVNPCAYFEAERIR